MQRYYSPAVSSAARCCSCCVVAPPSGGRVTSSTRCCPQLSDYNCYWNSCGGFGDPGAIGGGGDTFISFSYGDPILGNDIFDAIGGQPGTLLYTDMRGNVGFGWSYSLYSATQNEMDSLRNPNATAILRAGELADRTTFYRHDVDFAEIPGLPKNPHGFMVRTDILPFRPISLPAQEQIAIFFETNGEMIIQPVPSRYFEVPIVLPLPEALNFIP